MVSLCLLLPLLWQAAGCWAPDQLQTDAKSARAPVCCRFCRDPRPLLRAGRRVYDSLDCNHVVYARHLAEPLANGTFSHPGGVPRGVIHTSAQCREAAVI